MTATGGNAQEETNSEYIQTEEYATVTEVTPTSVYTVQAVQENQTAVNIQYDAFIAILIAVGVVAGILLSKTLFRRM